MGAEEVTRNYATCLILQSPGQEEKLPPLLSIPVHRAYLWYINHIQSPGPGGPIGWPRTAEAGSFLDGRRNKRESRQQGNTYHIIQDTSTIVASLKALKKRMSSSPSEPSFFRATPNARAKTTNPKMFIPSISVPKGTCRIGGDRESKFKYMNEN